MVLYQVSEHMMQTLRRTLASPGPVLRLAPTPDNATALTMG
jgi:hypothetical protein